MAAAIFDSDLIATRLLLAFAEFLWAAMLFWPGYTFKRKNYPSEYSTGTPIFEPRSKRN